MLRVALQAGDHLIDWPALETDLIDGSEEWEPGEKVYGVRENSKPTVYYFSGPTKTDVSVFTYLSTKFFCLRMRCTSAEVAGPWSFWPFSISFSSSSMLWQQVIPMTTLSSSMVLIEEKSKKQTSAHASVARSSSNDLQLWMFLDKINKTFLNYSLVTIRWVTDPAGETCLKEAKLSKNIWKVW